MKFEKALKHLREGKQVRLTKWPENHYLAYDNTGNIRYYNNNGDMKQCVLYWDEIWRGKWKICQISQIKTFDFNQAKEFLERAGRISRLAWLNTLNPKDTDYLFMDQYGIIYNRNSDGRDTGYALDQSDLNAVDWCLHNDLE